MITILTIAVTIIGITLALIVWHIIHRACEEWDRK